MKAAKIKFAKRDLSFSMLNPVIYYPGLIGFNHMSDAGCQLDSNQIYSLTTSNEDIALI